MPETSSAKCLHIQLRRWRSLLTKKFLKENPSKNVGALNLASYNAIYMYFLTQSALIDIIDFGKS